MNEKHTVPFKSLPKETQDLLRRTQQKHRISEQYHHTHFGNTMPISSCEFNGRRMVAVRASLFTSDDPKYDWENPSDFLASYLKSKLGLQWFSDQLYKDYKNQHEIVKWYTKGISNIEERNSNAWAKPNGKALALLHLAYDLFILEHEGNLPEFIINRLRNGSNFNGARYELFVFATLIRAGFDIEYSDEKSGTNGRVPECEITHHKTKQKLYVEAKTRNVKNVLGSTQGRSNKIRLYGKLKDALSKDVHGPYLIFIDVNHPNIQAKAGNDNLEKIRSKYKKLEKSYKNSLPNIVCFTNIPFHYGADDSSPEQNLFGFMLPRYPKYKLDDIDSVFEAINSSIKKYNFLPKEFNEADIHADNMLDNTNI